MKTRSAVKTKKAQQPAQAPAEVSRAPLPSSSAKSESTLSVRQARALRALAQASSSSSGVSVVLENEDINYVPIDGKVEIKYKVRPAGVTVSAKLSLQTGSGDATFEDGSKSQDIKDEGTLILLGATISSDVDNIRLKALSTERKLTVIDCVVQAKQTIGGQSIWRPEEEGESIDNLLAVWPKENIEIRVHFDPEDYKDKLPSKFIEWKFEEEEIPPNTVEKTFSFERAGGRQHKIEIKLKELKITRLVYIDVPDIGKTGQYAAALNVASSPGGVKKVALINQYREQASAWGATFQGAQADALRHAFGLALCASDWEVGASAALSIAKGHEVTSKGDAFQSSMDLYNNEVGAQTVHTRMTRVKTLQPFVQKIVGKPDVARIQQHLLQKYGDGQLWIWDNDAEHPDNSNGQIIRSDDSKIHQSSEQLE